MRAARYNILSSVRRLCSSPVSSIRPQHVFDRQNLFAYLTANGLTGFIDESRVLCDQFAHGQSNPTFVLTASSGQRFVMRKQPPGKLLPGAHAVDREYTVMTALSKTNVPIPRTLLHCQDASIIGTPFFLYEYCEGKFYKEASLPTISAKNTRQSIYLNMIDTLARIHAVDVDSVGLSGFGRRVSAEQPAAAAGYIMRQIKVILVQYTHDKQLCIRPGQSNIARRKQSVWRIWSIFWPL